VTSLPHRPDLDLAVVGHINMDHFLHVPALPQRDRTTPIRARETKLGGTAANIARSATGWGVATALVSRVGEDFPPEFRRQLVREGVDVSGVETVRGLPSPACFIAEDGRGGQTTLIDQGPMGDDVPVGPAALHLPSASWVHLTTGAPAYLLALKAAARRAGARVAVDPAQELHYRWDRANLTRLLDGAEIFFANAHELARALALLGLRRPADLTRCVPLVIATQGKRGVVAYSRAGHLALPADRPRRMRQVTGAGDAFRGGFYAGWFAGEPLVGCLTAGARSARRWIEGQPPGPRAARAPSGRTRP
jgi:sugar/nucleoside kinase (ribokinase family)